MEREARLRLLASRLAGDRFVSGETIGRELGVTRATVSAMVDELRASGMEVYSVTGRGHRSAVPFAVLDGELIRAGLAGEGRNRISCVEVSLTVDSTNAELQRRARTLSSGHAIFAEAQSAGRGRRGRSWTSPFGASLYGSLFWRFRGGLAQIGGLSLAVGVAVARAVMAAGVQGVGLKWPNDIVWAGRKLGGVLIEVGGEMTGAAHAVVGIGLNVRMPESQGLQIDQPWADILQAGGDCDRNRLAATLLNEIAAVVGRFEEGGIESFLAEWRSLDVLYGLQVNVVLPDEVVTGTCRGIDASGSLLLEADGRIRQFSYGEVSLRRLE